MALFFKVPQATVIIIERLGRFHRVATSGLRFCLPFLDSPKQLPAWGQGVRAHFNGDPILVELAEQQTDTQPRTIITRDNVEMMADAAVFWQIVDSVRAIYEVDNLPRSITDLAVTPACWPCCPWPPGPTTVRCGCSSAPGWRAPRRPSPCTSTSA